MKRENNNEKGNEAKNDDKDDDDRVDGTTPADFLIIYNNEMINFSCQDTSWMIDSGASIHITSRKDFFTSYISGDFGTLKI